MNDDSHRSAISDTIEHLAARWAHADKKILRSVFPLLAEGSPVPVTRIAEVTGALPSNVESALRDGRAGRDTEGRVIELSGLMLDPTMHRVEIGDIALFSCCALLALLVPALLGRSIRLESVDPVSRHIVRLDVGPDGVTTVKPEAAVSSFVVTEPSGAAEDVGANFCSHVLLFASPDSASVFVGADPRRYTLGIDRLQEAARMLYQEAWEG
jgi:alkylmercury lyase